MAKHRPRIKSFRWLVKNGITFRQFISIQFYGKLNANEPEKAETRKRAFNFAIVGFLTGFVSLMIAFSATN